MQAIEIVENLKNRKGQHVKISWQRDAKVRKDYSDNIVMKRTTAYVRSGIDYGNLTDIKTAIERGEREPVQGLPWGQWRVGFDNFIIDHNDTEYVRLYPASFDNLKKANVVWLLNGKEVPFETVEPMLLASEKRKDEERPACFTVKANDIVTIAD